MKTLQIFFALICATTFVFAAEKPNIVYVLFDDMGYGEPGCYRSGSKLNTPNLDRLAAQGMRFTDAHSASAVCTPTRYGILTGRYPSRIGQYGVLTSYNPPIISDTRLTVASLLKQHGYDTACIGKWHLGLKWDVDEKKLASPPVGASISSGPNQLGFDYFYGFTHARDIGSIIEQNKVVEHVKEAENQPKMLAKAVDWIEARQEKTPFFLYFPMCPPHTPIAPSPDFIGKSGGIDTVKEDPQYSDWLYQGDHMLGKILETLDKKGFTKNTLVIVTSDNGAASRPYPPLRAAKTSIYEGGHRVPFLVRWPEKVQPSSVNDQTICHNDLMATCADLLEKKLPADAGEDSVSFLPAILGRSKDVLREATIHQSVGGDLAIRKGMWKYIFFKNGKRELYHLAHDIGETKEVSATNPEVVKELSTLMQRYIVEGRSTAGDKQPSSEKFMKLGHGKHQSKQPKSKPKANAEKNE